ncbi:MAG: Bug family tripartite tricarboxylate transporter substrate binding protein [Beijerinckiaceae bacterium]
MGFGKLVARSLVCAIALTAGSAASAQAVDFAGKTITIFSGGGGYSIYSRTLAPYFAKQLPGQPTIIIKELPGAGSHIASNYIYEIARKDGTEIAAVGGSAATVQLFKTPGIRFDPRRFVWLGSVSNEVGVVASGRHSPVKKIGDVFERKMIVGGGGPTSGNTLFPTLANGLLGTRFEIIRGYKNSEEIALAIERGEVEGVMSWNYSSIRAGRPDWLRDGKITILLQLALTGHPNLKGVPLITDLAKNEEQRAALRLIFATQSMARPYIAPPGTPDNIAAVLRKAFDLAVADADFRAEAEKRGLDVNESMTGAQIDALIAQLYATPEAVVTRVNELMNLR